MKKTSRRNFGKQLTGAIAALPIASFAMTPTASGQQQKKKSADPIQARLINEHNTPPPIILMPGSLIIEATTDKSDWNTIPGTVDGRKKWLVKPRPYPLGPSPARIFIAHLKVLSPAGEIVFAFDNDYSSDKQIPIHVTATLLKNGDLFGDCHLTVEGDSFAIRVPDSKKLKKKSNDPSTNPRLRQRVRYMHRSNEDEICDFANLKIDKGTVNLVSFEGLMDIEGFEDLRILLWWGNY